MKNRKLSFIMVLALLFTSLSLIGCQNNTDDDEDTYTVWTDVGTYSEFQSTFNTTLDDGMYVRLEFSASQWSQISGSLTSEGKHSWTDTWSRSPKEGISNL